MSLVALGKFADACTGDVSCIVGDKHVEWHSDYCLSERLERHKTALHEAAILLKTYNWDEVDKNTQKLFVDWRCEDYGITEINYDWSETKNGFVALLLEETLTPPAEKEKGTGVG